MRDKETIPDASPTKQTDIDDRETILGASPRKESEDEIDEKIYKEPKLKNPAENEKQAIKMNDQKNLKSELEQIKVDLTLLKEAELKKVLDAFDKVNQEEPLDDIETFFISDNVFLMVMTFLRPIGNLLCTLLTEILLLLRQESLLICRRRN